LVPSRQRDERFRSRGPNHGFLPSGPKLRSYKPLHDLHEDAASTKPSTAANPVFYDVVALAIGYREKSFRTLLKRLVDTIILPPPDSKSTSDKTQDAPSADSH